MKYDKSGFLSETLTKERIEQHRQAEATVVVQDAAGKPLSGVEVSLRLKNHEFRLGANFFLRGALEKDAALQDAYDSRFSDLMNYATLPLYWSYYEAVAGKEESKRVRAMAEWCRDHGLLVKGHPLAWHECTPEWSKALPDDESMELLRKRVRRIVSEFSDIIRIWDVVNEATVSHRFENAFGRAVKERGASAVVGEMLELASAADPRAELLYNDFNVSEEYECLAADLMEKHSPVHAFGIQSHMHKDLWSFEKAWQSCESFSRFGLPLHFTEMTVLSGRQKAADDNDWHKVHTDWVSTPEGEAAQLEYCSSLFTLLFSHPAVEAITWWDFSDLHSWQGAPSGLLRRDMTPKPLYDWLLDAFKKRWTTSFSGMTDKDGQLKFRGFFGEYETQLKTASGARTAGNLSLKRRGRRKIRIDLP